MPFWYYASKFYHTGILSSTATELLFELQGAKKRKLRFPSPLSSDAIRKVHRNSWLPPGFKTKTPWKMILAICYYGFWFLALQGSLERNPKEEWVGSIMVVAWIIVETLFLCNYRDIHSLLPLTRSKELLARILGTVLYFFLIVILMSFFFSFLNEVIVFK